jgi:hypothetical protein
MKTWDPEVRINRQIYVYGQRHTPAAFMAYRLSDGPFLEWSWRLGDTNNEPGLDVRINLTLNPSFCRWEDCFFQLLRGCGTHTMYFSCASDTATKTPTLKSLWSITRLRVVLRSLSQFNLFQSTDSHYSCRTHFKTFPSNSSPKRQLPLVFSGNHFLPSHLRWRHLMTPFQSCL